MKKSIVVVLLISIFLLNSCWSEVDENIANQKSGSSSWVQNFLIETKKYDDFEDTYSIEKSAKILPSQNISVKSDVSWKVSIIMVKQWDKVIEWQKIVFLDDNYSKYSLDLEKAEINLEKSKINLESQIISLDKNIEDSRLNLEKAQSNYDTNKAKYEEDYKKAELDFENSKINIVWSNSNLALDKLNENILKAEFDYNNTLNSNVQQINTYTENVKTEYRDISTNLRDIINFSDLILWVTNENKSLNDSYEDYLWAKNSSITKEAKDKLLELIKFENELLNIDSNIIWEETILDFLNSFYWTYWNISSFLNTFELVLDSSIVSIWGLTQSDIDWYKSKINSYQSSNNNSFAGYTNTKNSINSFLNTYKQKEESVLRQLELLKSDKEISEKIYDDWWITSEINYNKTILTIANDIKTLESNLSSSKLNYETSIKNKEVNIKSLNNSISDSRNSYNKSLQEFYKLNITSPIDGVVWNILVDEWQNVSNGTQILSIIWDNETFIEVNISDSEYKLINIDDLVSVKYKNRVLEGIVYSKSSLADSSLNYKVRIILKENIKLVWNVVDITFSVESKEKVLPVDLVNITWKNIWVINTYSSWSLKKVNVSLWKVLKQKIEILWILDENNEFVWIRNNPEVIITDLAKFNEKKNKLVKKSDIKTKTYTTSKWETNDVSDNWKESNDIASMTKEERQAYLETLPEEEKQKVMDKMKASRSN